MLQVGVSGAGGDGWQRRRVGACVNGGQGGGTGVR